MRRLFLAVPFVLAASTAFGAGWESGLQEDEGGSVMMAWVQGTSSSGVPPELRLFCGNDLSLRYGIADGASSSPDSPPVTFLFDFGEDTVSLDMQYEDLDGMYAAYMEPDAPVVGLLRSELAVAVDAPSGPWPVQEFTLSGSSRAVGAVLQTCN